MSCKKAPISIFQGSLKLFQSWDRDFSNQSFLRFPFIASSGYRTTYALCISERPEEKSQRVQIDVNDFFLKKYWLAKVNRKIFEYST